MRIHLAEFECHFLRAQIEDKYEGALRGPQNDHNILPWKICGAAIHRLLSLIRAKQSGRSSLT
jgi:hypothetical protein